MSQLPLSKDRLVREQMLSECRAMAKFALAAGMKIAHDLVEQLDDLERQDRIRRTLPKEEKLGPADSGSASSPAEREIAGRLARAHNRLADLIAPATPKTVLLLATEEENPGRLRFLGAVPLVRRLMAVAIFSMVGFVWVSLSESVDGSGFDLLKSSGLKLLLSELFLFFAASIGASFTNLFEAQRYIKEGTFDPKFESAYWVRYVLGLMAGTVLALLIPIESLAEAGESSILQQLGKPMLALLGGFSASAVHRILNQIVAALESLVRGDTRDLVAAQEKAAKARLAEQETQNRMRLSAKLIHLEQSLGDDMTDPAAIRRGIRDLQKQLIQGEHDDDSALGLSVDSVASAELGRVG